MTRKPFDWSKPRGRNHAPHDEHAAMDHFMRNAWEPIAIPRWALTLKYVLFALVGLVTFLVGLPTLSFVTFQGYEPIWALFVSVGGILACIGSIRPWWGVIEAVGGSILLAFLTVLILALFVRGSLSVGILLVIVTIVPLVRTLFLFTHYRYLRLGLL